MDKKTTRKTTGRKQSVRQNEKKTQKKVDDILAESMNSLKNEMEVYSYDDDDFEQRKKKKTVKKKKSKSKTKIKIAILAAEVLMILGLVFTIVMLVMPNSKAWLASTWIGQSIMKSAFSEEAYEKIQDKNFDREDTGINEDLNTDGMDGYLNIALIGVDARYGELESGVNSDCMIVVSINKKTSEVRMASVYRDTHLRLIYGDGRSEYRKLNHAYSVAGPSATVKTLNTNLDLNITDYVSVNFDGIGTLVDAVGGIDVTLTKLEAEYVNGYINSYYDEIKEYDKMWTDNIPERAGNYTLNGVQAVAYSRIRYAAFTNEDGTTINNDFGRAARQRHVINQILSKAKALGVDACMELAEDIFESEDEIFLTSIPYDDIIELIPIVLEMKITESAGYPGKYIDYGGSDLIPNNLAQMVVDIHKQLFDDEDYEPSQTVLNINEVLCGKAGISMEYEK